MDISIPSLILIAAIAVAAPLLGRGLGRFVKIPLVVFEIVLGILLGPSLLGWVQPGPFTETLADFGLAMLFFLAGNEIDFARIAGRPMMRAGLGWLLSLAVGVAAGILFSPTVGAGVFIGIALTSTALGTIMPVLRDAGELRTPFGIATTAVGAVGEFGPLLAITLFLSGTTPLHATIVLIGFALITGAAIWLAAIGAGRSMHALITATLHTSGQFAVRLVILVLVSLVGLSVALGIDMLLGAFAAGVLYRVLLTGAPEADATLVEAKIEAIGFGFLVPIFFINTGVTFDLDGLIGDPQALLLLPIFVLALLVVRGLPSTLAAPRGSTLADRGALLLFGATGLPIIVAVTAIGIDTGALDSGTAAALVAAGMFSVLLFPLTGLALRKRSRDYTARPSDEEAVAEEA
ncbi:cation:proton antiporter [Microterricola viridarii]|uniref:Kef-type K+ transport system, membrane component KefB n=1 Tax=Microterricola viridarii TaxID=412690 RepID=A0A1H1TG73_9MICO|nr:cation:proton antiporter [Microterricola viridarii]SDS59287.1 Kef-type K+ transport system, membrane component KefB [Microterricola viridarii]